MKLTSMFATTALLIASAASPSAPAQAEGQGLGQNNAIYQEICDDVVVEDPNANFGECMSFLLSAEQGFLGAHLCDALLESGELELLDLTFSECVRYFRKP